MICEKCHKNLATMRYAEVINGKVSELMMCPECYKKLQNEGGTGFEIAGAAPSPQRIPLRQAAVAAQESASEQCRSCGLSLREVLETGLVGCPTCYEHHGEKLSVFLREIHGSLQHRGKTRQKDDKRERLRSELQVKRVLLRTALESENYEEAAVLRDAIRELEAALSAAPPGASDER